MFLDWFEYPKTFKDLQRPSKTFKNNETPHLHVITCQETWKGGWSGSGMKTSQDDNSMYQVNPLDICYILLWHDVSKIRRCIFHQHISSTWFWKILYFFFFIFYLLFCVFLFLCLFYISPDPCSKVAKNDFNMVKKRVKTGVLNIFQLFLCVFENKDWTCTIFYLLQDDYIHICIYNIYIYMYILYIYVYIDLYIYIHTSRSTHTYIHIYIYIWYIYIYWDAVPCCAHHWVHPTAPSAGRSEVAHAHSLRPGPARGAARWKSPSLVNYSMNGGFLQNVFVPPKRCFFFFENPKWMVWGYPYFSIYK